MGERLGKYELFTRIASGGMAEIHVARSSTLGVDKVVVIKRLLPQHLAKPDFVEMFLDEARIAAALNHPNVVQMYDFGPVDGAYFMAMEYLHGADLRAVHRHAVAHDELIPIEHVITVLTGVCSGLHHAHEAKGIDGVSLDVVHRDVTPHNVVVTFDGAVKLLDFGIAKAKNRSSETRHGTIKGKVPYMSPEQLRGESIDRRGDVYSLGVILYELTTGQRPYVVAAPGEFALMMAIVRGQIKPPSQVRSDYPPQLESIVMKAMARRPADRYQTAREVELALAAFATRAGLSSSVSAVSAYMTTVFSERLERWKRAKAEGKAFAEYVAEVEQERAQTDVDDESERELVDTTDLSFQVEWDADPQPPRSAPALSGLVSAGVDVTARHVGGVEVVTLAGRLTESFTGAALGAAMRGVVLVDLAHVERITSFGVREWLEMMHAVRSGVSELYLARLSESVSTQMGMIRSFAGPGVVVSFHAPYLCDACGKAFRWLVDCERDAEAVRARRLPPGTCPTCGSEGHLDDDDAYGAFAVPHAGVSVPPAVRAAHDALGEADQAAVGDLVEKLVAGNVTRLRVRGPLDRPVRWGRVLEGLEGGVVLDFQSPRVDDAVVASLAEALATVGPEVTSLVLEACPIALLEALAEGPRPAVLRVSTVMLEGACAACHASRVAVAELTAVEASARAGAPPAAPCRRCNGALTFDAEVERRLAHALRRPSEPGAPAHAPSRPRPVTARAMRIYVAAGTLGLTVLVVLVASLLMLRGAPAAEQGVAAAAADGARAGDDVLPAWTKQALVRETGVVILVGASGAVESERDGLELARADAIRRLVVAVLGDMPPGLVKEYATRRAADGMVRPLPRAELERIAQRFLRIAGTTSTPERIDVAFTRAGGALEVYARYSLGEDGVRSAVASYTRSVKLNGAILANELPVVPATALPESDVVVVGVESLARARGLAVGDRVLRVDERPVANLQAFAALTARPKAYALLVESSGVSRNVQLAR